MSDETEQTTETTQGPATRDDLIAAVREAGGVEAADVQPEESAAQTPTAPAEPATQETPAEEEPRIASILRAREKAAAEREAGRNQAEELIARARAESDRLMRDARERAEREWQEEMARRRRSFEENPVEAVRALGNGDPQRVVDAVLQDGTPQARVLREIQQQLAKAEEKAGDGAAARKELQDLRAELAKQRHEQLVDQVRQNFFQVATTEAAPHLHARYDQDEIFAKANAIASRWRDEGGLVLGKDFDYADVTQYLELESKKRLAPIVGSSPARQVSAGAPSQEPGNAPKVQANGPRTLSAAQGSERRTSPKPLSEMKSDEERRAALIEEVAAARRANPDAVF